MMSSPSLRAAVELGQRLLSLSFAFVRLELLEGPDAVELRVDADEIPEGPRQFLLERDLVAARQLLNELCASPIPLLSVSFSSARPPHAGLLRDVFACPVHFDAAHTGMRFSSAVLDLPLPQANAATVQTCEQLCRDLLAQRRQRTGVAARIRQRLLRSDDAFPGLEQIAAELGLTSRSLRRHLASEGTSFRSLRDECRELLAEQLLGQLRLSVEDVAARLGYAEASSFIFAFRRWKGMTPRRFVEQASR
jgi:AraC-like DNA-binding protein